MKITGLCTTKTLSATLRRSIVVLSTSFLLSAPMMPAQAVTIYKYMKDGIVTYAQLPPQGIDEVEVIELLDDGRRSNAGQMNGKTSNDIENEQQPDADTRLAELEAELEAQKAKDLAEQCQTRRYELAKLKSGGRIFELDNNGEKKFLDGRQIEQKRDTLESAINQYCN